MRVYELFLNDELKDGVNAISVVGEPAMESQFVALKKEVKLESYSDYPKEAIENAKIALRYAEENGWGDCGTAVGKARVNQLANGEAISEDTIARMASFARHKENSNKELGDGCGRLMWLAWGGDAGVEWASRKLEQIRSGKKQAFAKVDDKKKILMGVIMKPNKKIYRYDEESKEEYEVFFSEQTVRRASELYFKNNKQRNFNVEHNSDDVLEAYLVESWIVEDPEKDKSAVYNLGAEKGDWVGTMKFESDEEYQKALENGTGFSLEGVFSEKVILNKVNYMNVNFEKEKVEEGVLSALKKFFSKSVKMGTAKLMDGGATLEFEGDTPQAGASINLVTPDGAVPAPVGEHELEDGKIIVITEAGIIAEVKEKEAEVEIEVEQAQEVAPTTAMDTTGELKDMISSILVKFGEELRTDLTNHIEAKFAENKKAVEDLKVELSSQPAVEKTKVAPIEKEVKLATTLKGRLAESLTNLKNK